MALRHLPRVDSLTSPQRAGGSVAPAISAIALVTVLVLPPPTALLAAGNNRAPLVDTDAADGSTAVLALEYYERGLALRDKAWSLEERASTSKRPDKLLAKARSRWAKAVVAYQEAVGNDPSLHEAHTSLGYALRRLERFEDSLEAYDRALEIAPGYVEAIEYRAEAYLYLGRLDEVKDAYLELFRVDRAQAATLMSAMTEWLEARSPSESEVASEDTLDQGAVEAFAVWVSERAEIADQTEALTDPQDRSW